MEIGMSFWNSVLNWFGFDAPDFASYHDDGCDINPASGLPMVGGCGGVDITGSPYGIDTHHDDSSTSSGLSWDDTFSGGMTSWDSFTGGPWDN